VKPADAAAIACRYVADRVRATCGHRWLEGVRHETLPCRSTVPEVRFFAERRLRGVPDDAAQALCGWADGARPAELRFDMPTARELLAMSARGRRCVSLLDREGGLDFALHDLCHLEKFVDPDHHEGQVGFFALLEAAMARPGWAALEEGFDAEWARARDHVLCDMNASPLFLWCGLRCRVRQACVRSGLEPRARFERLLELVELNGPAVRAAAVEVSSRHAARPASVVLAGHFAAIGAGVLDRLRRAE
jgi:hypothetical protein